MIGHYISGCNQAHLLNERYLGTVFQCRMYGTFNINTNEDITKYKPVREETIGVAFKTAPHIGNKQYYWLVKIKQPLKSNYGWVVRREGSKQGKNVLEIISKEPLPDRFRSGELCIEVCDKWDTNKIQSWAKDLYWFQSFPWSPVKRADSPLVWHTIDIIDWSGLSVLDIGSHYGYHSFQASKKGAKVIGVEPNDSSRNNAITINDHIEMQDCLFYKDDTGGNYDVILYLSVHHQVNPEYDRLKEKINELKSRARKFLFVELIIPPTFGAKFSPKGIDDIIDGNILLEYDHKVRARRRIYQCVL